MIENTERLRHEIDSGRTGDKVAGFDPTIASLGTDDEAAGTPTTDREVTRTRPREIVRPHESRDRPGFGDAWILVAFTLLLATTIVAWAVAIHALDSKQHYAQVWAPSDYECPSLLGTLVPGAA